MTTPRRKSSLRLYHFGLTCVAVGIALWAMVIVVEIDKTTSDNNHQAQCNQGILLFALSDAWVEEKIEMCSPAIQEQLREKYDG